jgi:hypothetical protein
MVISNFFFVQTSSHYFYLYSCAECDNNCDEHNTQNRRIQRNFFRPVHQTKPCLQGYFSENSLSTNKTPQTRIHLACGVVFCARRVRDIDAMLTKCFVGCVVLVRAVFAPVGELQALAKLTKPRAVQSNNTSAKARAEGRFMVAILSW